MSTTDRLRAITLACAAAACLAPASAAVISNGTFSVEINEYGVLVGLPGGPLRTVDGPAMTLRDGFAEWYGVSFDGPAGHVEGYGPGTQPGWGERNRVEVVSFTATGETATAVTRIGELEIRTDFWFDRDGPYLIAAVTLTNTGTDTLRKLLYTRECVSGEPGAEGWTFPGDVPGVGPAPRNLMRRVWLLDRVPAGAATGVGFSYTPLDAPPPRGAVDVPLELWTDPDWPSGVPIGATNGLSFGDYDADGWIDMFAAQSGNLWRNVNGSTWEFAANLLDIITPGVRYGSSFGDYNNDGLPDIAVEPRAGSLGMDLLKNLGGGPYFVNVAGDTAIIDVRPAGYSETICWADVNGDADLDMFVPVYPPTGNFFLFNLGPTGPGGAYRFTEMSAAAGLDNPPYAARPEGAQFVDVDFDGDMDLYSNGTLYQNRSTLTTVDFDAMTESASGILFSSIIDEGAAFADYDLDGDYDLLIAYISGGPGVVIWESFGDGSFFRVEDGVIESPYIGLNLGLSAADWDNDGDIDFTTRQVFRRNMLMETGTRLFTVASHTIPSGHISSATPAWGDWDKDGDLDCALGNWWSVGHFYENTLYDASTLPSDRRYVRVRPLRDSEDVPHGLEAEYATSVELHIAADDSGLRRKKFTTSSAGYLNQNEYTLHFALPPDPAPGDPAEDLHFDVTVDFPSLPSDGMWRVDKHVNPALDDVNLADLRRRQFTVFRSGAVLIAGETTPPSRREGPLVTTAAGGLVLPTAEVPLSAPVEAPTSNRFVGLDFRTSGGDLRLRVREIILDGQLDTAVDCGGERFVMALWDVTDPDAPALVATLDGATSDRNRRSYFPADILLDGERHYRLAARVTELRETPIAAPILHYGFVVFGGLNYRDDAPCDGAAVVEAEIDPTRIYLTMRVGTVWPADHDFDDDGDVDRDDFAGYSTCMTGPDAAGIDPGCEVFDVELDNDIDLVDFAGFQNAFSGGP